MLKHKYAVWSKQVAIKNQVRYISKVFQLVWRICKNEIKLCTASDYVFEYITFYRQAAVSLDSFHNLAYETVMSRVFLNAHHM